MEIKTPLIRSIEHALVLLIITAIGIPMFLFGDRAYAVLMAYLLFCGLLLVVPWILSAGRTFVLQNDGIYIYLFNILLYKHSWSEIKSKYYIVKDVGIHRETVVLYRKEISYKLATILCENYIAPLSLIFINVVDDVEKYMGENLKHKTYRDQDVYLANQEIFWEKMKEWNISLDKCVYNRAETNKKIYSWSILVALIVLLCVIFLIFGNIC